jgi:diguanylate cyclase (GGDEF)-like protein/PAS domain S-box-containing protein
MPRYSMKIKMTLVVFLLMVTTASAVAGLGLLFFIREFKASMVNRQFSLVYAMGLELDDNIVAAQRELLAVARSITPSLARDPALLQNFLDKRLDLHQVFSDGTGFFSTNGVLIASSPGQDVLIGRDFSDRDFFRRTIETGKPLISEPFPSAKGYGSPVIVFTAPIFDEKGRLAGLLGGRVDLLEENFLGRLAQLKVGDGGSFFIFNQKREMIVCRDREKMLKVHAFSARGNLLDRVLAGFEGSGEMETPAGARSLCSFKRLKSTGWILAAQLPISEAYAPIYRARRLVAFSLAVTLPLVLLVVWFFVGRLTAPLSLLARRVREVGEASGEYQPVPVTTGDEVGKLAFAFNAAMRELGSQRVLLEKEKGFAEQLLQHTAVPCFVMDAAHRVIIWNRALEELTGFSGEEMIGGGVEPWRPFYEQPQRVLADIVLDGSLHEMSDLYSCYADSPLIPKGLRAEGWYRLKGRQRFLSFDAAPICDSDGRVVAAIETLQDVTLRANTEEQLRGMVEAIRESEERFRRLVELSLDGIAILVGRCFVFVNPAGCDMLGCRGPEQLLGKRMSSYIQRESELRFAELLEQAEQSNSNVPLIEERLLRKDRTTVEVELGVSRFVYRGEEALQVIFRDITERKLAKARLETLAHYDSLTSLPNRVLFFDRLQHSVSEAKRYHHALGLMFLDLDRFKQINDTMGHAAGDVVLVEAGRRLKDCVRACDMVARMGGDEFTIILARLAEEQDAALVADRIISAFSLPFDIDGVPATIGVSIGICVYPTDDTDLEGLDGMVRHADLALYRAKEEGRNAYRFYSAAKKRLGESRNAGSPAGREEGETMRTGGSSGRGESVATGAALGRTAPAENRERLVPAETTDAWQGLGQAEVAAAGENTKEGEPAAAAPPMLVVKS